MANEDLFDNKQQKGMAAATSKKYRNPLEQGADRYREDERAQNMEDMGEFTRGAARGWNQAKGMFHGTRALLNQAIGDVGDRNSAYADMLEAEDQASMYPAATQNFADIGDNNGFLEDSVDYVLGTLGELAPSMAEAAIGSLIGFAAGSAVPVGGNISGGILGALGKTAIRKGTRSLLKEMVEKGVEKKVAEKLIIDQFTDEAKRQLGKQALKSKLAKSGMFAATAQMETGGNYGEAVQAFGFDDASVAAAVGTGLASASLELIGGQSRIINKFLGPNAAAMLEKAASAGDSRLVTRIIKEAASQGGEEFLQEGGQELLSITNMVLNGDPNTTLLSKETGERLFEAGMKGLVGGGVTGMVTGSVPNRSRASNMGAAANKKALDDIPPVQDQQAETTDTIGGPLDVNAPSVDQQSEQSENTIGGQFNVKDLGVQPITEDEEFVVPKATPKPEEATNLDWEETEEPVPVPDDFTGADQGPADVENTVDQTSLPKTEDAIEADEQGQRSEPAENVADLPSVETDTVPSPEEQAEPAIDYSSMSAEDLLSEDMNDGVREALASRRDNLKKSLFDSNGQQRKGLPKKMLANYEAIEKKLSAPTATEIEAVANESATSPENDLPEPTQAQKEAGNYKMGHTKIHGLDISIENPKGSERSGVDPNGEKWSVSMPAHYGYVKRTEGADGDHVDVYIGDNPESENVFVVDQNDADTGKFDEHKVVLGTNSLEDARALYSGGFSDGRAEDRIGNITEMSVDDFKSWLKDGDQSKPLADKESNLPVDDFDAMFDEAMSKVANNDPDEKKRKPAYSDSRLKRKQFREDIVGFVEVNSEHNSGGEVVGLDELGKGGFRAPSNNPQWVQDARAFVGSIEKLRNAVQKAAAGEKLGVAQAEAVKVVLDEYVKQRVNHGYDKAKKSLESSREFRNALKSRTGAEISEDDLAEDGYTDLTDEGREVYEDLVSSLADDDYIESLAIQYEGLSDEEYHRQATRDIRDELERRAKSETERIATGGEEEGTGSSVEDSGEDQQGETQEVGTPLYDGDQERMFATPSKFGTKAQPQSHATNDDMHFNDLIEESKQGDMFSDDFDSMFDEAMSKANVETERTEQESVRQNPEVMRKVADGLEDGSIKVADLTKEKDGKFTNISYDGDRVAIVEGRVKKVDLISAIRSNVEGINTQREAEWKQDIQQRIDRINSYDNPKDGLTDLHNLILQIRSRKPEWDSMGDENLPALEQVYRSIGEKLGPEFDGMGQYILGQVFVKYRGDGSIESSKKDLTEQGFLKPDPKEHLKNAAEQAKIAMQESANAIKGILKNASDPNKLNSGIGVDDEIYQQIRPHLQAAWKAAKAAYGETREAVVDFIRQMIELVGPDVKPFTKAFYDEILAGTADADTLTEEGSNDDVSSTGIDQERNGQDGEASESVDEETVLDGRGGVSGDNDGAGQASTQEGADGSGDSSLSEDSSIADGEQSDQPVYREESTDGSENSDAGDFDSRRSDGIRDERGPSSESKGKGPAEKSVQQDLTPAKARKKAKDAESNKKNIPGDIENIREQLPQLLEGQQEDVAFAENRLIVNDGRGVAFTNGTGTGKTYTGLGIVKRSIDRGQDNVLIVVPNDDIARGWTTSGRTDFNLDVKQLKNTKDNGGSGPVITSYANFYQNYALVEREWDLFVLDESHTLNYNKNGDDTVYQEMFRALSHHPKGVRRKAEILHDDEFQELNNKVMAIIDQMVADRVPEYAQVWGAREEVDYYQDSIDLARKNKASKEEIKSLGKDLNEAKKNLAEVEEEFSRPLRDSQFGKEYSDLYRRVNELAESLKEYPQGKAVFLSATIFPYEKNIEYAEGFLFDYGSATDIPGRASYEQNGKDNFFVEHFGYRIRYGKLTEPDAEVDRSLMQINFNRWLRENNILSTRLLDVPYDYSREFALVDDAIGKKIDDGIKFLMDYKDDSGQKVFYELADFLNDQFDYMERMKLIEAIKAKHAIERAKKHMALGRKVIVFHNYNVGGAVHPFQFRGFGDAALIKKFEELRPDLYHLKLSDLKSPIETFKQAFGDEVLIVNGTVNKKLRPKMIDAFNDSNSGKDIMLLQKDAGKQGISLHDVVGDKQRALMNLGLPGNPVDAIQIEGRTYRIGVKSDAILEYMNTGTDFERWAFAQTIAQRTATAENLALGHEARDLLKAFVDAYENSSDEDPREGQGKGGKESDRRIQQIDKFDEARSYYFAQMKRSQRTKAAEGNDYYATPEPLGLKMVEWADIKKNETALEPSAGHGAIARWMPADANNTFIEPSFSLGSRVGMLTNGKTMNQTFEDLHIGNKYDAIVMNPPYGTGGKMAFDHLEKATKHLRDGGRVLAIVPDGPAFNKRFDKWYGSEEKGKDRYGKHIYLTGEISLPEVTFKRAGTGVKTKILILEKHPKPENAPQKRVLAIPGLDTDEFFSELRDIQWKERTRYAEEETEADPIANISEKPQQKAARQGAPSLEKLKQHHQKRGYDYFTVRLIGEKLNDQQFSIFRDAARATGAKYSSYRGGKVTPGYFFREEAAANAFIEAVQPVLDGFSDEPGSAFSFGQAATSPVSPIKKAKVENAVNSIAGKWKNGPSISVVASEQSLPENVKRDIEKMGATGKIDGALNNGIAYIVANKVTSQAQVERMLLHEAIAHDGVRKLFGADFQATMQSIYKQLGGAQGIEDIADKYGIDLSAYLSAGEKMTSTKAETMIVDELLAHLSELKIKPTLIQRIAAIIKAGLRKLGFDELAKYREADLFRILSKSRNIVVNGEKSRYILNIDQAAETAAALNPESDPDIMKRMETQLYVPERVHEETLKAFGQNRIGAAEKISRGSISGLRQVREISRSNWPEGEYSQLAKQVFFPTERESVRAWAKENNLILDNSHFNNKWESQGKRGGAEHDVYIDGESGRWFKRQRFTMSESYTDYFQRLMLTNRLNSWAGNKYDYQLEGFVEDGENLYPIVSQGDIIGIGLGRAVEELNEMYEQMGFIRVDKASPQYMGEWRIPGEDFILSDSYGRNIQVVSKDDIVFIDPLIKPDVATKRDRIEAAIMAEKFGIDTAFSISEVEAGEVNEFADQEERLEINRGLSTKSFIEKVQTGIGDAIKSFTRHFTELDVKAANEGEMADILRLAEEIPNASKNFAVDSLHSILDGLNEAQRDNFNWIVVLRDLGRDVMNDELYKSGDALPFGYESPAQVLRHLEKFENMADMDVKAAIRRRDSLISKHTENMVDAGILPESVLDDPHLYYHHQVMHYMSGEKDIKPGVTTADLTVKRKGWQKARKGSELDYNTEYIQSEFEILAQGHAQVETQRVLKELNSKFGISHQLKEIAKQRNLANFYKKVIASGLYIPTEPQTDPLLNYRQKMAMGLVKLVNMAADGEFHVPAKFTGLVKRMALVGENYESTGELDSVGHPQLFGFLSWLLDENLPGSDIAAMMFKAIASKNRMVKNTLGDDFLTIYDLIPKGFKEFRPKPGQAWYTVSSIPENVLDAVLNGNRQLMESDVRKVLARGSDVTWVLPENLVNTLENFKNFESDGWIGKTSTYIMGKWKQWILINPLRFFKYNFNNMSGDADIVLATYPAIFKNFKQAAHDLRAFHRTTLGGKVDMNPELRKELQKAVELGVLTSSITIAEIPDINKVMEIDGIMAELDGRKIGKITKGWNALKKYTTFRENILRLAAYRYFLENSHRSLYGVSKVQQVKQIKDDNRRAALLARELLGDYGNLTNAGDYVRRHLIPFWSWVEINSPRYFRLFANLRHEENSSGAQRIGVGLALKGGKATLKVMALYALVNLWNMTFFPDEEKDFGDSNRGQLHIILGRNNDGSIRSVRFQGAVSDMLSWVGLEDFPQDIRGLASGDLEMKDMVDDALNVGWKRMVNSSRPIIKNAAEAISGYSFYPDPSSPRPVYDRIEHLFSAWSLQQPYKWVAGKPKRGDSVSEQLVSDLFSTFGYMSDPGEMAYYDVRNLIYRYLDNQGIERPSGRPTDKGIALHYYKQALKYGDLGSARKYLQQYMEMGGSRKGMSMSIKRSSPLAALPKAERRKFLSSLSKEQRKKLALAEQWYKMTYLNKLAH